MGNVVIEQMGGMKAGSETFVLETEMVDERMMIVTMTMVIGVENTTRRLESMEPSLK